MKSPKKVFLIYIGTIVLAAVAIAAAILSSQVTTTSSKFIAVTSKVNTVLALHESDERTDFLNYIEKVTADDYISYWEMINIDIKHSNIIKPINAAKATVVTRNLNEAARSATN